MGCFFGIFTHYVSLRLAVGIYRHTHRWCCFGGGNLVDHILFPNRNWIGQLVPLDLVHHHHMLFYILVLHSAGDKKLFFTTIQE